MKKSEVLSKVYSEGVVAVVRGNSVKQATDTAEACVKGGIKIIEVTFTVPRADDIIKVLSDKYQGSEVVIGAGTVLDDVTARIAILAGAEFVVSPSLNIETIKLCNRYGVLVMAGISTPTEAVTALEYGVEILKLFPGDVHKPSGLKALKAPLPYANIMPTGGVSVENAEEWFKAGACAVGAGGNVTKGAATGDYKAVETAARELSEKVKSIIGGKVNG